MAFNGSSMLATGTFFLCIFLSIALMIRKTEKRTNIYFAGFLSSVGLSLHYQIIYPTQVYLQAPWLVKTYLPAQFLIGPFFFLAVSKLLDPAFRWNWRKYLHFAPFIMFMVYIMPFFLSDNSVKLEYGRNFLNPERWVDREEIFIWIYLQVSVLFYLHRSIRITRNYKNILQQNYSNISKIQFYWVASISLLVVIFMVISLFVDVKIALHHSLTAFNELISIVLSIFIILGSIGCFALVEHLIPRPAPLGDKNKNAQNRCSLFSPSDFMRIEAVIRKDKLYLDPNLTLVELSHQLNQSRTTVSQIINSGGRITFYDMINNLRVEEFKENLSRESNSHKNILDIAFDSGFNSKATFQRVFKNSTGMTPYQFRSKQSQKKLDSKSC